MKKAFASSLPILCTILHLLGNDLIAIALRFVYAAFSANVMQ